MRGWNQLGVAAAFALVGGWACLAAEGDAPPAPAAPAKEAPAAKPAEEKLAPELDALLDRIEAKAKAVTSLQAGLMYRRTQTRKGDEQKHFGQLYYEAGPPARFEVRFTRQLVPAGEGKWKAVDEDNRFIFDGQWMVERKDEKKVFVKRQVVAPAGPGQPAKAGVNPLADGTGPFVLPVNFRKSLVLSRFKVERLPPDKEDEDEPKNSVHLRLVPRPGIRSDFTGIDLYYDQETLDPLAAGTMDRSRNATFILLSQPQFNQKIAEGRFDVAEPKDKDWNVTVTPWKED